VPNGTPGDHPLTDILGWKIDVFGREADDLIRQIVQLGGREHLEREPLMLVALDPRYFPHADRRTLVADLTALRDRLRAEAIDRGWEVD
jgi:hypothetical protein